MFRLLLTIFTLLPFFPEPNPDDDSAGPSDSSVPKPKDLEIPPEIQNHFNGVIAEERRRAAAKAQEDERNRIKQEREEEDEKKKRQQEIDRGEFEKVKGQIESDLETTKGKYEAAKTENEALRDFITKELDRIAENLPEALLDFRPAEDAPLREHLAWATKAQEAREKLGTGSDEKPSKKPGSRQNPKPNGGLDTEEKKKAARRRGYSSSI